MDNGPIAFSNQLNNIPPEMRARRQWCYSTLALKPDGKPDKAPMDPKAWNGQPVNASVTDPSTWGTFEDACRAAAHVGGRIGFVLTADDPFLVIDLDDKGDLTPEQATRLAKISEYFAGTYQEVSQSGQGVHIVLRDERPLPWTGVRRDSVEVYRTERYIIMTGNAETPVAPAHMAEELDLLVEEINRGRVAAAELPPAQDQRFRDDEVLDRMFSRSQRWGNTTETSGERIRRWHKQGTLDGEDWSACDFNYLVAAIFASKGNWEQALRLFETSALWRGEGAPVQKYRNPITYVDGYLMRLTLPKAWGKYAAWVAKKDQTVEMAMQGDAAADVVEFEDDAPDFRGDLDQHPMPSLIDMPGLAGALARHRFTTNAEFNSPTSSFMGAVLGLSSIIGLSFKGGFESGYERIDLSMLYCSLLGDTGIGKTDAEGLAQEIISYAARSKETKPSLGVQFRDEVPSGQSIHTTVEDAPHQALVFIDELGLLLQGQGEHTKSAYRALVKLHNKTYLSAKDYTDKERNRKSVDGVSLNLGSSTTSSTFLKAVEDQEVTDGFLSRVIWFIEIGVPDLRPARIIKRASWSPEIFAGLDRLIGWCSDNVVARADGKESHFVRIRKDAEDFYESVDGKSGVRPWAHHKGITLGPVGKLYNRVPRNVKSLALVLAVADAAMRPQAEPGEIYIERWHLWVAFLIVGKGVERAVELVTSAMQPNEASRLHENLKKAIRKHTSRVTKRASYKDVSQTVRQNSTNKQLKASDIKTALYHLADTGEIVIEIPKDKGGMKLAVLK